MNTLPFLLILEALCGSFAASAFIDRTISIGRHLSHHHIYHYGFYSGNVPISLARSKRDDSDEKENNDKMVNVCFSATEKCSTDFVILSNNPGKSLFDFFKSKDNRNLLLTTGKGNEGKGLISDVEFTSELQEKFQSEARKHKEDDTLVLSSISAVNVVTETKFPGLIVSSINLMGIRLLEENKNNLPEYQFFLLDASQDAKGAPPVVWLFKKLTGSDKKEMGKKPAASSFTRIFAKTNENGMVAFEADGLLSINVSFPSLMMKLLPVKLDKFEEQGSSSIRKVLNKSLQPSINSFLDAYCAWVQKE